MGVPRTLLTIMVNRCEFREAFYVFILIYSAIGDQEFDSCGVS